MSKEDEIIKLKLVNNELNETINENNSIRQSLDNKVFSGISVFLAVITYVFSLGQYKFPILCNNFLIDYVKMLFWGIGTFFPIVGVILFLSAVTPMKYKSSSIKVEKFLKNRESIKSVDILIDLLNEKKNNIKIQKEKIEFKSSNFKDGLYISVIGVICIIIYLNL